MGGQESELLKELINNENVIASCEEISRFVTFELGCSTESNDSKRRFYLNYGKLLNIIFGEDGRNEGWMSMSKGYVKNGKYNLSDIGVAVKRLLSTKESTSLFRVLWTMNHPVEFAMDMKHLPPPSQLAITTNSMEIPFLYTHLLHKPIGKQTMDSRSPSVMLSMAEYYIFHFVYYAVSRTKSVPRIRRKSKSNLEMRRTWSTFRSGGMSELVDGNTYLVLLYEYLMFFLPIEDGVKLKSYSVQSKAQGMQYANIFLHTIMDMWLHQNSILSNSFGNQTIGKVNASVLVPVHTMGEYIAPPLEMVQALLITLVYLLNDCELPKNANSAALRMSQQHVTKNTGLTDRLQILQTKLFPFMRIVFAKCQVSVSPTTFFSIVDIWLAIAQPWKCREAYRRGDKNYKESGEYTQEWEWYVISNYHIYTTLFGALLAKMGLLDYSDKDSDAFVRVLYRVLAVYHKDLLKVLNNVTKMIHTEKNSTNSKHIEPQALFATNLQQLQLIKTHCAAIGVKLEDIPFSHFRRDAIALYDKVGWILGGKISDATKGLVNDCLQILRLVFDIADRNIGNFQVQDSKSEIAVPRTPQRDGSKNYVLTNDGKQDVLQGLKICSPIYEHYAYSGDPLYQPVRSYEFETMVKVCIWFTNVVNDLFQFNDEYRKYERRRQYTLKYRTKLEDLDFTTPLPDSFRFNFRLFASRSSCFFICMFAIIMCVFF